MLTTTLCLAAACLFDGYEQHQAIKHIHALGGSVSCVPANATATAPAYKWRDLRTSDEPVGHVVSVSLNGTKATDDDLRHLAAFPQLQRLTLNDTKITGVGFVHLKELTRLESVTLERTPLTKAGLAQLRKLGTVHSVDLWGIEPWLELVEELLQFQKLTFLEWDIDWADRRPNADRLRKQFPDLLIYSP